MIAVAEKIDAEKIKKDLYNKYDAILKVDEVLVLEIAEQEPLAFLKIKVFEGGLNEYKFLKREIRKRLLSKFNMKVLNIELDW